MDMALIKLSVKFVQWILHRRLIEVRNLNFVLDLSIILENEFGRKGGKSRFNARRVRHA